MRTATSKLARKIGDDELAEALVAAGYDNPAKIRQAQDKDLEKAVGKDKLAKLRGRLKAKGD